MTRHLATLSNFIQSTTVDSASASTCGIYSELYTFFSCRSARPLSQLKFESAHTLPCSTTAIDLVHTKSARHGISPIVFTDLLLKNQHPNQVKTFEAFPVPGYVAANHPQRKVRSTSRSKKPSCISTTQPPYFCLP
jgi:hypothetical protein